MTPRTAWVFPYALLMSSLLMALAAGSGVAAPAPPVDLPPIPGKDVEAAIGMAENAGGLGAATFLFAEEDSPWAALVVNAGTPEGVDRVSVTYTSETRSLLLEVEDDLPTNVVTILVSGAFVEDFVADADGSLSIEVPDAVNYEGLVASEEAGGEEVYVFVVTHFSVHTILLTPLAGGFPSIGEVGLNATGWVLVGTAVALVVGAAGLALRRRE